MTPLQERRPVLVVGWVLAAGVVVLQATAIMRAAPSWFLKRMPDDAFYYLEIGRRLGEGGGFTFDGINETNGFHPLWQGIVAVLSIIAPSDRAYIQMVLLTGLVMSVAAVALVARTVARVAGPAAALLGSILALSGALGTWSNGMEGPAVMLTLAVVLTLLTRWDEEQTVRNGVWVGVACAACVVARLDMLAVIWLVPAAMAWRARAWRSALPAVGGMAALGLPLGIAWLLRFGHPLTTSATVKSHALSRSYDERFGGRASTGYVRYLADITVDYVRGLLKRVRRGDPGPGRLALLALALVGAVAGIRRTSGRWSPAGFAIGVLAVVVAAKAVVDLVAVPLGAGAWYAAPQQLTLLFAVGVGAWKAVEWCAAKLPLVGMALAVLVTLLALPLDVHDSLTTRDDRGVPGVWQHELDTAAAWVRAHGPQGRYGARDAGLLGFRLDGARTLVNLDGLVNDYDYAAFLATDPSLVEQVHATGVDFLIQRLSTEQVDGVLACADELWRSEKPVSYADSLQDGSSQYVYVLDVRGC